MNATSTDANSFRTDSGQPTPLSGPVGAQAERRSGAGYTLSGAGTSKPLRYGLLSIAFAASSSLKRFA